MEGNQVKMREALEEAKRFILDVQGFLHGMETTFPGGTEIIQKINAVLSVPPRQCDVGTVEQQFVRYHRFCMNGKGCSMCKVGIFTGRGCSLAWAQLPYEKEGVTNG